MALFPLAQLGPLLPIFRPKSHLIHSTNTTADVSKSFTNLLRHLSCTLLYVTESIERLKCDASQIRSIGTKLEYA
jgi:hypothetical protein